jgi:glycosyltransferase involved in cell wall biosynthesis
MGRHPLVSIVVAIDRSRPDHLSAALLSALSQTLRDIEVIVTDDSPDDGLRGLVEGFHDPRVRYVRNLAAVGLVRSHWAAFERARGEFVVVLNHDDWLAPQFAASLADVLQRAPYASVAFCDHWVVDASGRRLDAESERNSTDWGRPTLAPGMHRPFARLMATQTIPMVSGAMFRRAALPAGLPADAGPAFGLWLSYLFCRSGGGAWYVPERMSARRCPDPLLGAKDGLPWLYGSAACWKRVADDRNFAEVRTVARRKAAMGFYGCALHSWAAGHRADCIRFAWRSLGALLTLKGLLACMLPLLPRRWAPPRWARRQGVA